MEGSLDVTFNYFVPSLRFFRRGNMPRYNVHSFHSACYEGALCAGMGKLAGCFFEGTYEDLENAVLFS